MSAINEENASFWRQLAKDLEKTRPNVGKNVLIDGGRKHKGKSGIVRRHQIDKFQDAYRYGNDASHHMRDLAGRYGWCVQIETKSGELFWCKANYCKIID